MRSAIAIDELEQKMRHHEQTVYVLTEYIETKGAESLFEPVAEECLNIIGNVNAETIKVLLKQPGIAIEDQLPGGRTALSQASKNGHIESVELLLAAKCNPSANSSAGSCLQLSRKGGHDKIVELLMAAGAKA